MNPRGTCLAAIIQLVVILALAQKTDSISPSFNFHLSDNSSDFNADLRPLHGLAGSPAPFYTYLWEFGDGKFSFEKQPKHVYPDTGIYNVRLYATNNYDDGKPPPTRPHPVRIRSKTIYAVNNATPFFKQDGAIEMKVNRMPKPDEDMVLIIGYRNQLNRPAMKGSLVLFYNERQFKRKNFDLAEERAYNQEIRSTPESLLAYLPGPEIMETTASLAFHGGPSILPEEEGKPALRRTKFADLFASERELFRQVNVWRFENLQKGEDKYFFLTLHTAPEMIKDTNAVVSITGMFVPDDADAQIEEYTMELQIVASHDPNRMLLKNRRLSYRFAGTSKKLTYRVIFQNTGEGPAHNISLSISVPSMLDPQSLEILDYQPKCPLCDSSMTNRSCLDKIYENDSIRFIFKNIYLQGLLENGMRDPDSTKGFVEYWIHFNRKLKKLPFDSRAAIVFDGQKTVYSNPSQGDFKPGRSPGLVAGYGTHLGHLGSNDASDNNFSIGSSLSPYAPYRRYFQSELFLSYQGYSDRPDNQGQSIDTMINGTIYSGFGIGYEKLKVISLDLVPAQLRYNLCDFVGMGAGPLITVDAFTLISPVQTFYLYDSSAVKPIVIQKKGSRYSQWFKKWDFALFADVQLGNVRGGPALGIRYLRYFSQPQNRLFIYALWHL